MFDPTEYCDFPQTSSVRQSETSSVSSELNHDRIVDELFQLTNEIPSLNGELRETITECNENVIVRENIENPQREEVVFKLKEPPDLNEILATDEAAITPTSHNVGVLNSACQQVLKDLEQQLLFMLKKNKKEQEVVQNYLNSKGKNSGSDSVKKSILKCLGMPYFKDLDGYLPPQNQDVLRKKRNHQFLPIDFIDNSPPWSNSDVDHLLKAVNPPTDSPALVTTPVGNLLKAVNPPNDLPVLVTSPVGNLLKEVNPPTDPPAFVTDPDAVDWMKISVTDMGGKFSPSECKSKWMINIRPGINRSKWKPKEIKSLEKIAGRHSYQDWDKIAEELGTKRTGFQCCVQYQSHRAKNGGKWTKEEDETLKKLIEKYKVKDHIPWRKVAWHFEDRSLRQCQERFIYSLANIKKGNFTMEEDFILAYLATKMKNFGEVAKYLPKRVSTQVRARFEYLVKTSMPEFTKEEDELLTKLVSKHARNWGKISESFANRSKLQCRGRWAALQKDIELENNAISDTELEESENTLECLETNNKDKTDSVPIGNNFLTEIIKSKSKKCPEQYDRLLDYHRHCYKFLFGPKVKYLINSEDWDKIIKKLRNTMTLLSVDSTKCVSSFDFDSLSNDCEFDEEDTTVLSQMKTEDEEMKSKYTIIPPNYMTLVGLRSLNLSWTNIRKLSQFYKPRESTQVGTINSEDRLLCTDAKKLFKSRMKSLFVLPLILSNISQEGIQTSPVYKPKVRKTKKPLSKLRRKAHAKLMTQKYRNLLQEQLNKKLEKTGKSDLVQRCDDSTQPEPTHRSEGETGAVKKRGRPKKQNSQPATVPEKEETSSPVKKKRGRPSKRKRTNSGPEEKKPKQVTDLSDL